MERAREGERREGGRKGGQIVQLSPKRMGTGVYGMESRAPFSGVGYIMFVCFYYLTRHRY